MSAPGPASRIGHVGALSLRRSALRKGRSDSRPLKAMLTRNRIAAAGCGAASARNIARRPCRRTRIL